MKTYKEVRTIPMETLCSLCQSMGWYTRGSSISYSFMLSQAAVKDNLTTEDIIGIALDIAQHSDLSDVEPETDVLSSIAYEIARASCTQFVPVEEGGAAARGRGEI